MTLLLREAETTQTLFSANAGNSLKSSHVRQSFFITTQGVKKNLIAATVLCRLKGGNSTFVTGSLLNFMSPRCNKLWEKVSS